MLNDVREINEVDMLRTLRDNVKRMRKYQKAYFKYKNFDDFQNAKVCENEVDRNLKILEEI